MITINCTEAAERTCQLITWMLKRPKTGRDMFQLTRTGRWPSLTLSDNWQWWLSRLWRFLKGRAWIYDEITWPHHHRFTSLQHGRSRWVEFQREFNLWQREKMTEVFCMRLSVHLLSFSLSLSLSLQPKRLLSFLSSIIIGWSHIKALNRNPVNDRQSLGGKLLVQNILFMWKWNLGTNHKSLCQQNIYKGSWKKLC